MNAKMWKNDAAFLLNKTYLSRIMDIPAYVQMLAYKNATTVTVKGANKLPVRCGTELYWLDTDADLDITANLDTGVEAVGTDYFVYICDDGSETPVLIISANATAPDSAWMTGEFITQYRMIGGFHNGPDGDILQYSVWHLNDLPTVYRRALSGDTNCQLGGMVKSAHRNMWYDNYLANISGKSEYGTQIWNGIVAHNAYADPGDAGGRYCSWFNAVDVANYRGKRLLFQDEFMEAADGTPQEVNIYGSNDPIYTGKSNAVLATRAGKILAVTIAAGGAGYSVNDVLTVVQAGGSSGTLTVTGVNAGVITSVTILASGAGYTVANTLATTVAPSGGSNCTINITSIGANDFSSPSTNITTNTLGAAGHKEYEIEIDANGAPDTFKWRSKVFGGSFGSSTAGVAITGANQTLADGVVVKFTATTGHAIGDKWNIYLANGNRNTTATRIKSTIGCEDMCGVVWQWGQEALYRYDGTQTFSWKDQATSSAIGNRGALYTEGTYGFVRALFGGGRAHGVTCGSRGSYWGNYPWLLDSFLGVRFGCEGC